MEVQGDQKDIENQGYLAYLINTLSHAPIFDLIKIVLLCYFLLLLVLVVFGKNKKQGQKQVPTRERLLRRFLFANQDVIKDLDEDEKKLMTETFEKYSKKCQGC